MKQIRALAIWRQISSLQAYESTSVFRRIFQTTTRIQSNGLIESKSNGLIDL